ncbi:hypothetical protein J3R83DRAFT_921 [Lanmaoa asiatica]|nr:hypothetical protein J3R83DRAFT_921 [Lanmaoa asiatica]
MNVAFSVPSTVSSISFSFLSTEDIRRISVKQILNPVLLDDLNRPNVGGLYDPALGPSDRQDICATCRLNYFTCPGHYGHIELPSPVYHPLFMANMYNILRGTCLFCHRFKTPRSVVCKYVAKLRLMEHGLLEAAHGVDDIQIQLRNADATEDSQDETEEEFENRIDLYVAIHLSRASSSKRDYYKNELVYQARKEVILDFLRITISKTCQNCRAYAYTFRREGFTKIIEYDLSTKHKNRHRAVGLRRPNVLLAQQQAAAGYRSSIDDQLLDEVDDSSDSEPEGDLTYPDEEEAEVASGPLKEMLPKSASGKVKTSRGRNERVMSPEECRAHLRRLFENCPVICSLLFGRHGPFAPLSRHGLSLASPDIFFMDVLLVPPTRFRPPSKMGETLFENPQNELLARVLNTSYRLRDLNADLVAASVKTSTANEAPRRRLLGSLLESLIQLQVDVNSFLDSSKNPQPLRQGKLPPPGIKQGLEKKEGLFRKHMMGKRVNYAARSVISPDVNIEPNEIGIPPVFARKLTYPEPVTPLNVHQCRRWVINGPKNHPGASMVEFEDGRLQLLDKMTKEQRQAIADMLFTPQDADGGGRNGLSTKTPSINKKVYRHLQDGDILILNRQPTLHKPSMMCHKARILQGEKTIRMHYANWLVPLYEYPLSSYVNRLCCLLTLHYFFPENPVAQAEARFIANTDSQYLVPTSGKPLRGLIQDHVVAGVWMTCQDTFFSRDEYFQLLYGALRPESGESSTDRLKTLPPAVWVPKPLWTGKQVISTVLLNITPNNAEGLNLESTSKVPGNLWGNGSSEDKIVILDGELLRGILDKSAFGATDYGLVHSVHELYGATVAGQLLGILSRLFTKFLQHRAFTCRMDDLVLTPDGDRNRTNILLKNASLGTEGAIENFPSLSKVEEEDIPAALTSLLEDVLRDDSKMAGLDVTVKSKLAKLTKSIADTCIPSGLLRKFPHNHMQAMTQSGAKGSAVNAQQISCALGQQELEGRRVPVMVSGKTLPSFKSFETKAIAGGYVASRFLTGVKPQEFYFHCMAGREGLIDTAVKTSRSGYLQRCLIKHLEGIRIHYDNTVRGSDSSVYQFLYGGDGLDVTKQKHLFQFKFVAENQNTLLNLYQPKSIAGAINDEDAVAYMKKVRKQSRARPSKYAAAPREEMAPALDLFSPSRYLGSTSEKFAESIEAYLDSNPPTIKSKASEERQTIKRRQHLMKPRYFRLLMNVKYLRSLVEPGEAVGLLASQGDILNYLRFYSSTLKVHGAANVTLGIPRLREIVMTASQKPKTPSMTMDVVPGVSDADITTFCKRASKLVLSQIIDKVTVKERLSVQGDTRRTEFSIDLSFYPEEEYVEEYDVDAVEILTVFGIRFPSTLKREIQLEMKKLDADLRSQITQLGKGKARKDPVVGETDADADGGGESTEKAGDAESEQGDADADDAKRALQRKEQASYESDEGNEEEFDDAAIEAVYASEGEDETDGKEAGDKTPGPATLREQVKATADKFVDSFHQASSFKFSGSGCSFKLEFPADFPKLLLVGIVERACRKTVIREIPGIADCFKLANEKGTVQLTTNGSNFRGIWQFAGGAGDSIIDYDTIYSNDIYSILKTYGVEMARAAILREVGGVFSAYKIDVDIRHLELIADYMTFDGGYKPFNRKGLSTNPSPLLKASYETTATFLSEAALFGDFDDLSTPSGNIVIGRPNLTGTGVFDVVMPVA